MRSSLVAVAAVAATLAVPLTAAEANAGPVRFSKVQYDGPGNDTGSNASLNKEWITVKNFSNKAKTLTGWTVRDPEGHVFKFPTGFKLKAGKSVTVHTGDGKDTNKDLYWDHDGYVWNNTGDKATLKKKGKKIDVCKWGDGDGSVGC